MRSILVITFLTLALAIPATAAEYPVGGGRPVSKAGLKPNRGDICAKQCHRTGIAQARCLCECEGGTFHPPHQCQ